MLEHDNKIYTSATGALKGLWEEGYFRTERKFQDIDSYLQKMDHNFGSPEMGMALKRAKFLTRKGARGNYTYIQKHPYTKNVTK